MNIRKLFVSELPDYFLSIQSSHQILPFFKSHQEGRTNLINSLKEGKLWVAVVNQNHLFFSIRMEKQVGIIDNFSLVRHGEEMIHVLKALESVGKWFFLKEIALKFSCKISKHWKTLLIKNGYFFEELYKKRLVYNTALVLGGGGARGAYQIGAWKALKEHQINFSIISGTSVGALNGALILQDDLKAAEDLWQSLSTSHVLDLPSSKQNEVSFATFFNEARQMTSEAIRQRGISTRPLKKMLEEKLSEQKIQSAPQQLFSVSTRLKDGQEIVSNLKKEPFDQLVPWLLASASFFPLMAIQAIEGQEYVDGGYRNNVPLDVVIDNGADEAFVIDVKGPGPAKKINRPPYFVEWSCASRWSLGNFLLFDERRNQQNMQLGYLEMKKVLNEYQGKWYTFGKHEWLTQYNQKFLRYLLKRIQKPKNLFRSSKFRKSVRTLYKEAVVPEELGIACLEMVAKTFGISPLNVYTVGELENKVLKAMTEPKAPQLDALLGPEEWAAFYREQFLVFSKKEQFLRAHRKISNNSIKQVEKNLRTDPLLQVLSFYLSYLKEETTCQNFRTKLLKK